MRTTLFEFYKPDESELKKAWDSGIFTFDSNVLLNFYRYSSKTTKELFDILKHLNPKLWLSNQAGYEYLNNRLSVIHKQKIAYEEIKNILSKKLEELSGELNSYKKHSTIEVDNIKESIQNSFESIYAEIEGLSKSHPTYEPIDKIKDELTKLFDGKTGKPYSKEKLNDIFKEGQTRYENEIPPGYKDRGTKKDSPKQSLYGDIILWKQIIEKAKADSIPIILVTDDLKEDWWDKFKGETQGPRKELLREFSDETGQKIYIYQADKFLEYANKLKIGKTIKAETIKEIRDVRIKDEQHLKESSSISESLKKYIETQRNYFDSDEYKKMIETFSGQTSMFKLDPEMLKRIQDNLDKYWARPIKFNYSDLIKDQAVPYPFTDQQKAAIQRIIEIYANKKSDDQPYGEDTNEDKPKE